ncbi:ESX-1 secretion-associated protein EspB [Triticum aestivum]|uniref:ESX-1 secretion-associated protein EspB n=1 Tax=Triticum aestivum TaxID=4565 RepID=UPI001ABCA685|nr:ESX-1 secretion-associated protein EspB-like [Triticum aestivum]
MSTAQAILAQRNSAYMEFQRQQLYEWNQRVAAVTEHNSRMTQLMFASMATGQIPTMEPPPPPPGPQPVVPTFEQFLADHYNVTPGTGASSTGGGATDGSNPESRSPVTPVWLGGGGGGGASASGSGDDLGFGGLGFGSGSDAA